MGSCCRGRGATRAPGAPQHPDCRDVEQAGALMLVYPMSTPQGLRLVIRTARHGLVDIGSYATALQCGGTTVQLLRRYAPDLQKLAAQQPNRFSPWVGKGLSLSDAVAMLR